MIPDSPTNPTEPVKPDGNPIEHARRQADAAKHPRTPRAADRIGPYKILEMLGEGGMGTVYLAEQTQPLRRVALKVIKPGMDSKAVIARFEAEEQALALMNHPNVAQVFDAGTTEQGRPYFVMEHVAGVPITEHCDRHKLSIAGRLELFVQVCEAVQHAHQKGVIHRDIKPSNILVAFKDERSVPKVIDFGVAKAIGYRLTEETLFTQQGQLIGTPDYMSPEQAEMSAQNVDTRTDIYSLGVLLYELLTGTLPFDRKSLHHAAFDEIRRMIREVEPPKPSTRVSSMITRVDGNSTMAADNRMADPRMLIRRLRGDLDWITIRALEKDRARRYASASGLAADIRRHLSLEPVVAGPPSAVYRFKKLVRRNRGLVTGLAAVMVVMVVSTVVSLRFAIHAERQAAIAAAVNAFLNDDLLASAAPEQQGRDATVREVLDTASKAIEGKFDRQPQVEASIRMALGNTYKSLGEYQRAEPHLERATKLRRNELGEEHASTLESMSSLGGLYDSQGRYDEARALWERTLDLRSRLLGREHPDTLESMDNLARLYWNEFDNSEAEDLWLRTLELRRRVLGEEHPDTLVTMGHLALVYWGQTQYGKSEPLWVRLLELRRSKLGEEHPDTLYTMRHLGMLYRDQHRYDEAEPLLELALDLSRRVLGEEHPDTLESMGELANLFDIQGRYEDAEPLYVESLELSRHVLGVEHTDTLELMNQLAALYGEQGRYDEAEPLCKESYELSLGTRGEDHPCTLTSMANLGELYENQGWEEEAERWYVRTLELRRKVLGVQDPHTRQSMDKLASLYEKQARYDEAEPLLLEWYNGMNKDPNTRPAQVGDALERIVKLYEAWGDPDQAAIWRGRLPVDTPSNPPGSSPNAAPND